MQIEFGAPVFGAGGKRLGEVDGLVVNAGTKRASAILVDAGLFDRGKHMIGVSAITSSDQDGLHLDEPAATSEAASQTLDSEEVSIAQRVEPPTEYIPAAGVGGRVYADTPAPAGEYPEESSFFELAPLDPPVVEVESNLGQNEVVLGSETHAISSDHQRLGNVTGFELGDMGLVESISVSEGLIFKERRAFTLNEIDEFGTNAVHLRTTQSAAEAN
jgi:PRC-barrel domain